jgi:hypothetical protein
MRIAELDMTRTLIAIAALYTEKWIIDWQKDLRHGLHSGVAPTINEQNAFGD